jgi:hypothetical protein
LRVIRCFGDGIGKQPVVTFDNHLIGGFEGSIKLCSVVTRTIRLGPGMIKTLASYGISERMNIGGSKREPMGIQQTGEGRAGLQIWACGYRVQCSSPGCQNLARVILRKVAPGGAPDGQSEFCHQHARADIAKATADGVGIYDMRTTTVKKL